jgi:AcrR family transcriptional regulator
MSPRSKKQLEELKKIKRIHIMNSALELFSDYGYYGTSINMIAQKAGIAKGLVYSYFENKDDLLKELIYSGIREFENVFDADKDGFLTEDEFEFFIDESFKLLQENISFWRLYFLLVMKKEVIEIFGHKFIELTAPHINILTDYYKRKNHENPETEAVLFGAMIDGVAFNYVMNPEKFPLNEIKSVIIKRFK